MIDRKSFQNFPRSEDRYDKQKTIAVNTTLKSVLNQLDLYKSINLEAQERTISSTNRLKFISKKDLEKLNILPQKKIDKISSNLNPLEHNQSPSKSTYSPSKSINNGKKSYRYNEDVVPETSNNCAQNLQVLNLNMEIYDNDIYSEDQNREDYEATPKFQNRIIPHYNHTRKKSRYELLSLSLKGPNYNQIQIDEQKLQDLQQIYANEKAQQIKLKELTKNKQDFQEFHNPNIEKFQQIQMDLYHQLKSDLVALGEQNGLCIDQMNEFDGGIAVYEKKILTLRQQNHKLTEVKTQIQKQTLEIIDKQQIFLIKMDDDKKNLNKSLIQEAVNENLLISCVLDMNTTNNNLNKVSREQKIQKIIKLQKQIDTLELRGVQFKLLLKQISK